MQAKGIIEAALNLKIKGIKVIPAIMIPLVGTENKFIEQKNIIEEVISDVIINEKIVLIIS